MINLIKITWGNPLWQLEAVGRCQCCSSFWTVVFIKSHISQLQYHFAVCCHVSELYLKMHIKIGP